MLQVCSEGKDSNISLKRCVVTEHEEACVAVLEGASLVAEDCDISRSRKSRGISVEGSGTKATFIRTKVSKCCSALLCVLAGSDVLVSESTLFDCAGSLGQGVCVQGESSRARLESSVVKDVRSTIVVALNGGVVDMSDMVVSGSLSMQGVAGGHQRVCAHCN